MSKFPIGTRVKHAGKGYRGSVVPFPEIPNSFWPRDLLSPAVVQVDWDTSASNVSFFSDLILLSPLEVLAEVAE